MENNPKVLVVNASAVEREQIILHTHGCNDRVEFTETPSHALDLLATGRHYDAIFMGIDAPSQEHCRVLEAVRNENLSTAVVLMSPIDDVAFYLECLRKGAFDYIPRPVNWKEFRRIYDLAVHQQGPLSVQGVQAA
ncbi:MAG: response regulator [Acidobacteriia bacterium]|nr:response regulator [Terriglobia bacterium]